MKLQQHELDKIWAPNEYDPAWKSDAYGELKVILEKSNNPVAQWLTGLSEITRYDVKMLRTLEGDLGRNCVMRNALRSITMRVQKFEAPFPLARIAIYISREACSFNPDSLTVDQIKRSFDLISVLQKALLLDVDKLDLKARLGLLILSAAYHGGLLDIEQLKALMSLDIGEIEWKAAIPEVRLLLPVNGNEGVDNRQWFPDPCTLALLMRSKADLDSICDQLKKPEMLNGFVNALLKFPEISAGVRTSSLTDMLQLLRMQVQMHIPPLLVNFASRDKFLSHSVREDAWAHIFGYDCSKSESNDHDGSELPDQALDTKGRIDPDWLDQLVAFMRKNETKQETAARLSSWSETKPGLPAVMASWLKTMLLGKSAYGNSNIRETILSYLRIMARSLSENLQVDTIFDIPPDALDEVYETLLDLEDTPRKRKELAKAIREFHWFLHSKHGYPPISENSVLGINRGVQAVDATIISEEQYQETLKQLSFCGIEIRSPRLVMAAKLMVILGYRLGIRRNEGLKLLIHDLQLPRLRASRISAFQLRHKGKSLLTEQQRIDLNLPVHLHIRPNAFRYLKTRNSTRTLPLHELLSADELSLLLEWHALREQEELQGAFSDFLFCIPADKTVWISEEYIFPAIHAVMRAVTGNQHVHYHHLRHSCATWLMLKLMIPVLQAEERIEIIFQGLPETSGWLMDSESLKRYLFHFSGGPTRRVAHIVSALLGHASPKTTLRHYVHCLPWLLAMAWQWNPERWYAISSVAKLAGVSDTKRRQENSAMSETAQKQSQILELVSRYMRKFSMMPEVAPAPRGIKIIYDHNVVIQRMRRIESFLAYAGNPISVGAVDLDWFEFPESDRLSMVDRAKSIQESFRKNSGHTTKIFRVHRFSKNVDGLTLIPKTLSDGARQSLSKLAQAMYSLLSSKDSARAHKVVDDFIERVWSQDTDLRFNRGRDITEFKDYIWLLKEIGVAPESISFVIYSRSNPSGEKDYWRQYIHLSKINVVQNNPKNHKSRNHPIAVRVSLPFLSNEGNGRMSNYHSGTALRYLFVMTSIDWHFRQ